MAQKLRLFKQELDFVYCARHIQISEQFIRVDQAKSSVAVDSVQLADGRTRQPDSLLDGSETSQYRSVLGQVLWLAQQSRLDLCVGVSLLARRTTKATVEDAQTLNCLAKSARDGASHHVCLRHGLLDMSKVTVLCYGDAAFANAGGEKSQYVRDDHPFDSPSRFGDSGPARSCDSCLVALRYDKASRPLDPCC